VAAGQCCFEDSNERDAWDYKIAAGLVVVVVVVVMMMMMMVVVVVVVVTDLSIRGVVSSNCKLFRTSSIELTCRRCPTGDLESCALILIS
jgi:hypothetical protein